MTANPFWIDAGPGRRLAILPRPRGGDWLSDEVAAWKRGGVQAVVSMLTAEEVAEFDLHEEGKLCLRAGIDFISLPVTDRGVPDSRSDFEILVERLRGLLEAGRAVGIHCRAGVGRSATLAASVLIALGVSTDEAIRRIENARGVPVPETQDQRAWIDGYAAGKLAEAT